MRDLHTALGHHFDQVTVTELVGDIPADAKNNDGPIKVATMEESS